MVRKTVKKFMCVTLVGCLSMATVTNCMAGKKTYTGKYVTVSVSNTSNTVEAIVYNSQPSYNRYAGAWETSYNKNGKVISNKTNYDNITSGARSALDVTISGNVKTIGGGKIYSGKTPSTTLLESKSLTVYV